MKHEESGEGEGRRDRLLAALTLIGGAGFFIAVPFALQAGAEFFLPLAAALVIAIVLVPFLEWMERRGMPSPGAAVISVIFFLKGANVALGVILFPGSCCFLVLPARHKTISSNTTQPTYF